jgi:uncharacterized protein YegJ (DUF2314 family)
MRRAVRATLMGLGLLCLAPAQAETLLQKSKRDATLDIATSDPQMKAAFARAQKTLATFLDALDGKVPGAGDFAVKIPVVDGAKTEYFWVNEIAHKGNIFSGKINNRPETVHNVEFGQTISFPRTQIRDWGYTKNGRMQGNFSTCVLLSREDPAEAQELKDQIGLTCK